MHPYPNPHNKGESFEMKHAISAIFCFALFVGCFDEDSNPVGGLIEEAGLSPSPDQLHGTWYVAEDQLAAAAEALDGLEGVEAIETEFREDNTFTLSVTTLDDTVELKGTWSLDGSTMTQVIDGESGDLAIVIVNDTLTMTDEDGGVIIYSKKE